MTRLRYQVAASLDGFIADAQHGSDWIVHDPSIDFTALFAQFDTFLMGRVTYEKMRSMGQMLSGERTYVFSRTLSPAEHCDVTVIPDVTRSAINAIRQTATKDLWLFGGGRLFRSLLAIGAVDTVEVAVIPILLGEGVPIVASLPRYVALRLATSTVLPSGIVMLEYEVTK